MPTPVETGLEVWVQAMVLWLKLGVEALGALVVGLGIVMLVGRYLSACILRQDYAYNQIRLRFARILALALELQLAADILSTAVAPSWDQIGKLCAIAIVRTALNFFLAREIKEAEQASADETGQRTP